jgi:hypothetical protein
MRLLAVVLATVVVLAFAALVWPTPYRYFGQGDHLVRINRATGSADQMTTEGWYRLAPTPPGPLYDQYRRNQGAAMDTGMKMDTTTH